VRAYALVELGDSEAIDLFLREEDAQAALKDALRARPHWAETLSVEPVELDVRVPSRLPASGGDAEPRDACLRLRDQGC
jgi:hypothetical protein